MTTNPKKINQWDVVETSIKQTDKYPQKGVEIVIFKEPQPVALKVENKFDKSKPRTVYRVNSNIGFVLLSQIEILKVKALFDMNNAADYVCFTKA